MDGAALGNPSPHRHVFGSREERGVGREVESLSVFCGSQTGRSGSRFQFCPFLSPRLGGLLERLHERLQVKPSQMFVL